VSLKKETRAVAMGAAASLVEQPGEVAAGSEISPSPIPEILIKKLPEVSD
jgi:hypothetical protein